MYYRIGEFARKIGVSKSTLRSWQAKGILEPHHISPTGFWYYSEEQANQILNRKIPEKGEVKG